MKTLIVLRHGKAADRAGWKGSDHARNLTSRGRDDSARMGRLIASLAQPDLVLSSDAARASETAELAAAQFGRKVPLRLLPEIYWGGLDDLLALVRGLPDDARCVALVGHNPTFEDLAAALSAQGTPAPSLSTAAFAHLEFDAARWRDVREGTGRLVGVHSPKSER